MPTPPPTFAATPVVLPADVADMPTALGPRVGTTTDNNNAAMTAYAGSLQANDFSATYITTPATFITATALHAITGATFYTRGNLRMLKASIARTGNPTNIAFSATGGCTAFQVATLLAGYRPPYDIFFFSPIVNQGPPLNMYITAAGAVMVRGCTQPGYTTPALTTWTAGVEVMWFA